MLCCGFIPFATPADAATLATVALLSACAAALFHLFARRANA